MCTCHLDVRLPARFLHTPAESSLSASLESLQQDVVHAPHVIFWFFAQTLFLGVKSIKSIPRTLIDTIDTFRGPPLTPYVLSAFTIISDDTRKYFAISVCTGYYRVGHSPLLLLYYELLILFLRIFYIRLYIKYFSMYSFATKMSHLKVATC